MTKRRPYAARVPIEVRREQLLDAAIRVIVRDGYDGISVEAIAREAGVTRPVVYGAFDGLGPLPRRPARPPAGPRARAAGHGVPESSAADPGEAMLAAVRTMAERVRSDPLTWRPILAAPQATPDVVRLRIDADRELVRSYLQGLLEGVVPAGVDVELAAHALVATLEYFGRVLVEDPDRFDARTAGRVRGRHLAAGAADPRLASPQGECGRGDRSLSGRARGQRPGRYRDRAPARPPAAAVPGRRRRRGVVPPGHAGGAARARGGAARTAAAAAVRRRDLAPRWSTSTATGGRSCCCRWAWSCSPPLGVALLVHALLPGVGWPAAFAIGAVVAPPDAVAATAIGRRIGLPRRIVTILEGESLLNDATALVGAADGDRGRSGRARR